MKQLAQHTNTSDAPDAVAARKPRRRSPGSKPSSRQQHEITPALRGRSSLHTRKFMSLPQLNESTRPILDFDDVPTMSFHGIRWLETGRSGHTRAGPQPPTAAGILLGAFERSATGVSTAQHDDSSRSATHGSDSITRCGKSSSYNTAVS